MISVMTVSNNSTQQVLFDSPFPEKRVVQEERFHSSPVQSLYAIPWSHGRLLLVAAEDFGFP